VLVGSHTTGRERVGGGLTHGQGAEGAAVLLGGKGWGGGLTRLRGCGGSHTTGREWVGPAPDQHNTTGRERVSGLGV
jgi:hypothetical protein